VTFDAPPSTADRILTAVAVTVLILTPWALIWWATR